MPDILIFSRIRSTFVEQVAENKLCAVSQLTDTVTEAMAEIVVRTPELEIVDTKATIVRATFRPPTDAAELAARVRGVRIGPGMKKIIRGLIGDTQETRQLAFMIEECCNAVILSFTKDVLLQTPEDKRGEKDFYRNMVKENIRLYNRCAAFAPGSPLVEGIEPPS